MGLIKDFTTWLHSHAVVSSQDKEQLAISLNACGIAKTGTTIPEWDFKEDDWLEQDVEDCLDPSLGALYRITKDLVPEKLHGMMCVAGGFAAHLAGITNKHNDIDLFCYSPVAFDIMQARIIDLHTKDPGAISPGKGFDNFAHIECYRGRVIKFVYEGISYDLVDKPLETNVLSTKGVIFEFDLNWSMCAIDLESDIMTCNLHALSDTPKVNPGRTDDFIEGTIARLEKYGERLVKEPDTHAMISLGNLLGRRKARLEKEQARQSATEAKQKQSNWY